MTTNVINKYTQYYFKFQRSVLKLLFRSLLIMGSQDILQSSFLSSLEDYQAYSYRQPNNTFFANSLLDFNIIRGTYGWRTRIRRSQVNLHSRFHPLTNQTIHMFWSKYVFNNDPIYFHDRQKRNTYNLQLKCHTPVRSDIHTPITYQTGVYLVSDTRYKLNLFPECDAQRYFELILLNQQLENKINRKHQMKKILSYKLKRYFGALDHFQNVISAFDAKINKFCDDSSIKLIRVT